MYYGGPDLIIKINNQYNPNPKEQTMVIETGSVPAYNSGDNCMFRIRPEHSHFFNSDDGSRIG